MTDDGRRCTCPEPMRMANGHCALCTRLIATTLNRMVAAAATDKFSEIQQLLDVHDPTRRPDVHELPAATTTMDATQFQAWLDMPGQIFIVYLPAQRSFVIKVPPEHNAFFVAMMKQIRTALGPEVQAQSAQPTTLPPRVPSPYELSERIDQELYAEGIAPVDTFPENPCIPNRPGIRTVELPDQIPARCAGSGKPPATGTERNRDKYFAGRGACRVCHGDYRLTNGGNIWAHKATR